MVKTSPSEDLGKILASLHGIQASGEPHFGASLKIAMLALKHRKNKNGGQRVIVFVGSPVQDDDRQLKRVGAMLKKNNVSGQRARKT